MLSFFLSLKRLSQTNPTLPRIRKIIPSQGRQTVSERSESNGFTIVELLVVIVIIGILATITAVSYTGITQKANAATLQSDLKNASTILEMDKTIAGTYPATKEAANNGNGLNPSPGTDLTYTYISNTDNYTLVAGKDETSYFITSPGKTPTIGTILDATLIIDIEIASGQIADDKAANGTYPATEGDANGGNGLQPSPGVDITYTYNDPIGGYTLIASKDGTLYSITSDDTRPVAGTAPVGPVTPTVNTFAVAWGGTSNESGYSLVQTSDGGYAVTGTTDGFGGGNDDILLTKYDSVGNLSWVKTWGGIGGDIGISLVQTTDGGYAMTGGTYSYGSGNEDMFISKYDSAGNLSWNKTWGGASDEYGISLVQTSDGGYAATGQTYSYGAGSVNMFLVKYDSAGNLSWNRTWGGTLSSGGRSLVQTTDGGYTVAGWTNSYGAGGDDMLLAKYDSAGNLSWSKIWGGAGFDDGTSIVQTTDGGYAVTGHTNGFGAGDDDMFLVKYDSAGNLSWNRTWGGTGYEYSNSLVQTTDGGYVVAGFSFSYGAGGADMFLVKYDSAGNLSWNRTWGSTGYDFGCSIVQTSDGGYSVTGRASSYGAGNYDLFLVKYNSAGDIAGCLSPMCQSPTATVTSPTASVGSPTVTVTSPTVTVTSPTATVTTPTATTTVIVAP